METNLKPCPFCGGKAYAAKDRYGKILIGCVKCNLYFGIEVEDGCELEDGWRATFPDAEAAVNAWNARVHINPEEGIKESEEWCSDCDHIEMCRWYPTMGCCFKESTEELSDKHWNECRQIALYQNELSQALDLLSECYGALNALGKLAPSLPRDVQDYIEGLCVRIDSLREESARTTEVPADE